MAYEKLKGSLRNTAYDRLDEHEQRQVEDLYNKMNKEISYKALQMMNRDLSIEHVANICFPSIEAFVECRRTLTAS